MSPLLGYKQKGIDKVESGFQKVVEEIELVKGYKLLAIRWIKSEELMYHVVTLVDNTIWHSRTECSHPLQKGGG